MMKFMVQSSTKLKGRVEVMMKAHGYLSKGKVCGNLFYHYAAVLATYLYCIDSY